MFKLLRRKKSTLEPDASTIVPRLKTSAFLEVAREYGADTEDEPFVRPFVADLLVAYGFDLPEVFMMVTHRDMARLGLSADQLDEIARGNLKRSLRSIKAEGDGPLQMVVTGGDLEACLMLLDDFWPAIAQSIPGEMVVSVPTRSILLLTSSESPDGLALMRELTDGAIERERTHCLSANLFMRRGGEWLVWQETPH